MSRHFSANQFDPEFAPQRLCNWEVPKNHRSTPVHRKGSTKIISNERGHLLPGIQKSKQLAELRCASAQPKSIAKDQFSDLNATPKQDLSYKPGDLTDPNQRHHSYAILDEKSSVRLPELNSLYVEKPRNPQNLNDSTPFVEQNFCCEHEQNSPNHNSVVELIDQLPQIERTAMRQEVSEKPGESNTIPLIPAYCNFQAARKMAQENLEHQPLPDSIMDRTFLKMQGQGLPNPELSLNVEPTATGVGVRTHNAGPTHCTKLKVYRPKTCGVVPPPISSRVDTTCCESRPQTAFNHKSKIEPMDLAICWDYKPPLDEPKPSAHIDGSEDTVAPAIFSVVKTPRPIDDQNNTGRSAGVFAHTAGEEGFFDKDIMLRNKNYFSTRLEQNTDRECECKCSAHSRSHSASRKASLQEDQQQQRNQQQQSSQQQQQQRLQAKSRCKSSPNLSVLVQPSEASARESILVCNYNKEHYHYRPEPTQHHRNPVKKHHCCERTVQRPLRLCEQNLHKLNQHQTAACTKHSAEFKAAFKAGAVKSQSSGICSSLDHKSNGSSSTATEFTTKVFRIPKPKQPYAKKNYSIDTLAPPFACWRGGAGQGGYPEHWRLASVYQHAYKPIEQRKRPLLATVFQ